MGTAVGTAVGTGGDKGIAFGETKFPTLVNLLV